jgi:hypothetical protein
MPDVPRAEQPALRIEQREKVSSVVWQEETRPRNYGTFLILIHAVSPAIPKGMAIASTIERTFIGICCLSYLLRIASREI